MDMGMDMGMGTDWGGGGMSAGAWVGVAVVLVLAVVCVWVFFVARAPRPSPSPSSSPSSSDVNSDPSDAAAASQLSPVLALRPQPPPLVPFAAPRIQPFAGTRVPARVVFTYKESSLDDLEPSLRAAVDSWRADEDGVRPHIVYYNDADARAFLARHVPDAAVAWDALVPAAFKADIFRACEIYVYGGLYCDIKCTRVAPYAALIGPQGTVTLERNELGLWNGCFAAPPGAAWVGAAIVQALANVRARSYATTMLDITGPTNSGRAFRVALGLPEASGSCEFMRADVQRGPPDADWTSARATQAGDAGSENERRENGDGIRVLAMRVSNSDFFDIVSGPSGNRARTAFKTGIRVQRRDSLDPVSNYGFAYRNGLVYYPLPPLPPPELSPLPN